MKILVLNAGSSSLKFQLIQMPTKHILAKGLIERIGLEQSKIRFERKEEKGDTNLPINNHKDALQWVVDFLEDEVPEVVGHRVVHGGSKFSKPTLVNLEVLEEIQALSYLAPLHNPANVLGIEVAKELYPKSTQVAVFDTAFHTTIPPHVSRYAIPNKYFEEDKIQVYGFHGTSHAYVFKKTCEIVGYIPEKLISLHLGNGCSVTAIHKGQSVDHSLGFSPGTGLVMGTRSGDIDPAVVFYLMEKRNMTATEVKNLLNKQSGLLGLTGSSDLRDIEEAAANGDKNALFALELICYRIKKYIGAYAAAMNGLDALVFTAGIGENSSEIRKRVCQNMEFLGIKLDLEKNTQHRNFIESLDSLVKIGIIPTNEELEIAQQAYKLCS